MIPAPPSEQAPVQAQPDRAEPIVPPAVAEMPPPPAVAVPPVPPEVMEPHLIQLSYLQQLWLLRSTRLLLVAASIYGLWWLFSNTMSALTPFVVGLILAYLLLPVVNRLNQRMPRWAAIAVVYVMGLGAVAAVVTFVVPPVINQIRELATNLPNYDQIKDQSNRWLVWYNSNVPAELKGPIATATQRTVQTVQTNLTDYVQNVGQFVLNSVLQVANTVAFLFGFLVIPFWLFYILNDQTYFRTAFDNLLPRAARKDVWAVLGILDDVFSKYIRGQLFLGLVVGVMAGIGLVILQMFGLKVPYILLLAIIAGITELIPVVGPIIGAVPAVVLALFADSPATTVVAVVALYIVIQQVENQFLVPRIVGESVGLHPAVLMVLLVVCSAAFGLAGAILAAPASAAVRNIFGYLYMRLSIIPQSDAPNP